MQFTYKLCARGQPQRQGGGQGRAKGRLALLPEASGQRWGLRQCEITPSEVLPGAAVAGELGLRPRLPWKVGACAVVSLGTPSASVYGFPLSPREGPLGRHLLVGRAGITLSPTQPFTPRWSGFPGCELSGSLRGRMPPSRPAHMCPAVGGGPGGPDADAQVLGAYCLWWSSVSVRISRKTGR